MQNVLNVVYLALGLLIALVVHEFARAWMAVRLGDQTPRNTGRLTLDPRPHVDPLGTVILPGLLLLPVLFGSNLGFLPFAYAKPLPVNPWGLRKPDRDVTLIALAGPAANILLALGFGVLVRAVDVASQVGRLLHSCLIVTIVIGVLNLVPLPPLDGSRVVARFLPPRAREFWANADQFGGVIILVIFFIIPGPINAFVDAVGGGICRLVAGSSC
jgi:Zn-dependent protease